MENQNIVIGLLSILVLLYFIKQVYNVNATSEGFIDTKEASRVYKEDGDKFLKTIENKYIELSTLNVPINVDDYGNQCVNWSEMDVKKPNNIILENQCVPMDGELKCISDRKEGTLNSCEKMAETTIGHMVNVTTTSEDLDKYAIKHIELEQSVSDMNNDLSKLINDITEMDNISAMQRNQIKQNKELIELKSEKSDNLKQQNDKKTDAHNIDYQTVSRLRDDKTELLKNIDNITYYTKIVLVVFILVLLAKVLNANIKILSKK